MELSPFTCPQCHSDETSSFEMIYQGETDAGMVPHENGKGTNTHNTTTSPSMIARQFTPPVMPAVGCGANFIALILGAVTLVLAMIVVNIFLSAIVPAAGEQIADLVSAFVPIGCAVAVFINVRQREAAKINLLKEDWELLMKQRRDSRICLKCGNRWYPAEAA